MGDSMNNTELSKFDTINKNRMERDLLELQALIITHFDVQFVQQLWSGVEIWSFLRFLK